MTTERTLRTFLDFYVERGHHLITGSTLLPPPGDPVLFTTSGMHPLTPYLEGRPHPLGRRLVNVQRCLRTTDLEEVGDSTHLTLFEMLGSWSLDDYGHPQSLRWGHELLTDGFGIPRSHLYVTVFGGDGEVGPDTGSLGLWEELGVPVEPTTDENWWSNGPVGPCGPDSEIFVWTGGDTPPTGSPTTDPRWVEVWNHVHMKYRRHEDGSLEPLRSPSVDTGMGLERLLSVLQGCDSVHETDLLRPWSRSVRPLWDLGVEELRLVCDHLRSGIVVVGEGVRPSPSGRGHVLRRLVRRLLTTLWQRDPTRTLGDLPGGLVDHTLDHFRMDVGRDEVRSVLLDEERRFRGLLDRGRTVLSRPRFRGPLTDEDHEYLHDTHGLPRDLVIHLRGPQPPDVLS
ncbi:alanine--tRNA ligase-related protein [Streptomyces sp. NPDC090106]|uniref:alanine--tRNA ligase-related protein n=1 Tax=Streptomyces sp. NPDC090106 TaxID=3365946 RepID=UPI0037FDAB14